MMTLRILAIAALAVAIPSASNAQGHKCACCAGNQGTTATAPATHPDSHTTPQAQAVPRSAPPAYDVEYEGRVVGIVESVMRHQGMDVQLTVGVGENRMEVIVAPMDWLDEKQFVIRPGERVEVIGALMAEMNDAIIAREIRTGTQTMVLRDTDGKALWNY
jgi:hypothetical protein